MGIGYAAPTPITAAHRLDSFDCGNPLLDAWLKDRALPNEGRVSRTYVICTAAVTEKVVAYFTLATGSVLLADLPRRLRHNLPNPVPVMVLGRLAVDRAHQRHGLAKGMLREALLRTAAASRIAGLRMLIVHPIDDAAAAFYARYGFLPFPPKDAAPTTQYLPVETLAALASEPP